jgi:hypothetical protein
MEIQNRRLQLDLFVHKIFLGRVAVVAVTMEDIAIGATAVIGTVDGIAANVEIQIMETTRPTDGAQVAPVLQITIGAKVVQAKVVQTKLTATVVTALVTHAKTLAVNALAALATATMATITATVVHTATVVLPAVEVTQAVPPAVEVIQAVPVQQPMSIVTPATVQPPHAAATALNAATTIPGGAATVEEVITMGGEAQVQLMGAAVKTQETKM